MGRLVLYAVGGIVAIAVVLKVALALLGTLLAVTWFAVARVLPLLLAGWCVMWLWKRWKRQPA